MRVGPLLVVSIFLSLSSLSSCGRPITPSFDESNPISTPFIDEIDRSYMSQLRSLSVSGAMQACLLVGTSGSPGRLKITTNGGKTWRGIDAQTIGEVLESATLGGGARAWVLNHNGTVFTTISGGDNWVRLSELNKQSSGEFQGAKQLLFVTENDGWINGSLNLLRTRDGGTTWQEKLSVLTPEVKGTFDNLYAIDANTILATGDGRIYLSTDGGDSWKIIRMLVDDAALTDLWFADKTNGYLIGYVSVPHFRPLLYVTQDGGESWKELPVEDQKILPESVCFVGTRGWIAGRLPTFNESAGPSKGVLWHTTDAGRHWKPVELPFDDPFFATVRFTDDDHGWLIGRDNLYRTEDGGVSWHAVMKLPPIKEIKTQSERTAL